MKLSQVKGDRVFEVVATIIDPIASIALDEDAARMFKREEMPEGLTAWQFFLTKVRESLPTLIRGHKDDLCTILAAIGDVTVEEYVEGLTLDKFMADIIELLTDGDFRGFFA